MSRSVVGTTCLLYLYLENEPDQQKTRGTNRDCYTFSSYRISFGNSIKADSVHDCLGRPIKKRIEYFEIIWVTSGKGQIVVDMQTLEIEGSFVIFLSPGQVRTLSAFTELKGYYISLSQDFFTLTHSSNEIAYISSRYFSRFKMVTMRPHFDQISELTDVISKIQKELSGLQRMRSEILRALVKVFIIYVTRSTDLNDQEVINGRDAEMVTRFMALVKNRFKTMKKVADYASQLCVTPNYLNQMVKRVSGYPASYHIQQQIVLEAKRQAAYSDLRMKEIADSLGFHDYAHFSKFFKTYSGISFSSFKSAIVQ